LAQAFCSGSAPNVCCIFCTTMLAVRVHNTFIDCDDCADVQPSLLRAKTAPLPQKDSVESETSWEVQCRARAVTFGKEEIYSDHDGAMACQSHSCEVEVCTFCSCPDVDGRTRRTSFSSIGSKGSGEDGADRGVSVKVRNTFLHYEDAQCDDCQPMLVRTTTAPLPEKKRSSDSLRVTFGNPVRIEIGDKHCDDDDDDDDDDNLGDCICHIKTGGSLGDAMPPMSYQTSPIWAPVTADFCAPVLLGRTSVFAGDVLANKGGKVSGLFTSGPTCATIEFAPSVEPFSVGNEDQKSRMPMPVFAGFCAPSAGDVSADQGGSKVSGLLTPGPTCATTEIAPVVGRFFGCNEDAKHLLLGSSLPQSRRNYCKETCLNGSDWTTLMIRNLPNLYSRDDVLELLAARGFAGKFDFLYYPIDFETHQALGYAFVNVQTPEDAKALSRSMDGFSAWDPRVRSKKVCSVSWSQPLQGLEAHIARYRNSPTMHEVVPDAYRPVLFANGVRIDFPSPTKRIKPPRKGHQRLLV